MSLVIEIFDLTTNSPHTADSASASRTVATCTSTRLDADWQTQPLLLRISNRTNCLPWYTERNKSRWGQHGAIHGVPDAISRLPAAGTTSEHQLHPSMAQLKYNDTVTLRASSVYKYPPRKPAGAANRWLPRLPSYPSSPLKPLNRGDPTQPASPN